MELDRVNMLLPEKSRIYRVLGLIVACVFAAPAWAQMPLPQHFNDVVLEEGVGVPFEVIYRIDLDTLPPRPRFVVEVTPNLSYEDIQLEVRLENWVGLPGAPQACHPAGQFVVETSQSGPLTVVDSLFNCDPNPDTFNSGEVDVVVRVLNFGAAGAPAEVDLSIYATTQVPTNTLLFQVETDISQQTVALNPSKDTTLYLSQFSASNGAGSRLWAGAEVEFVGGGPFGFWSRRPRRPLLAFDLLDEIPFNANIDEAELRLYTQSVLGGGGSVSLFKLAPSPAGVVWPEGNAVATGSQFSGASSSIQAANWNARRSGVEDWVTPGGDTEGLRLGILDVTSAGTYQTFSSLALERTVQEMIDAGNDVDGFLMTGPGTSTSDFADRGVAFYSKEALFSYQRPVLTVTYTPDGAWSDGILNTGVVSFTDEGDNFRWIYDTDQDDILTTEIGGVCEVLAFDSGQQNFFPYTYSYEGPSYTGLDCCVWQIDSDVSGTTGTGQALFFHNLDISDPANDPPDTDNDGIVDFCDNCPTQPNGPAPGAWGTCVNGTSVGGPCGSDLDCSAGEICNQSQQDSDLDGRGDACPVPEPGFAGGLMVAGALLSALSRRSRIELPTRRP